MSAVKTPPAKVIVMNVDRSGNIRFNETNALFRTNESPQVLRIDTSQLHQQHPGSSIVKLKIGPGHGNQPLAAFVEDGASPPNMRRVGFDTPLQGRIDSILIVFNMRTDYPHKTGPFPIKLRIAKSWAAVHSEGAVVLSEEDYDPQVGNDPPFTD
jgi:hypothetical protein